MAEMAAPCNYVGGCENYGPLLVPLNTCLRIMLRTQNETMILTTAHIMNLYPSLHLYLHPLLIWTPKKGP